ncbi:MAG: hypothetical protein R3C19_21110 [Planctomycetaceae bacterium]
MTIRANVRILTTCAAFALSVCGAVPVGASASDGIPSRAASDGDLSFASELWKSEFLGSSDVADGSAVLVQDAATAVESQNPDQNPIGPHAQQLLISAALESISESASAVDAAAEEAGEPSDRGSAPLSAWQIATAKAEGTPRLTTENAGGPTLTVYLVGLVAVIVLGGTLLSGRE